MATYLVFTNQSTIQSLRTKRGNKNSPNIQTNCRKKTLQSLLDQAVFLVCTHYAQFVLSNTLCRPARSQPRTQVFFNKKKIVNPGYTYRSVAN